ncbi:glycosyltransferase AglI [Halolamina pelagica]|uniref:Glycosyltransferase AglI n=1 Tax=Halolamina pelagica TaxID=699431 RepID=A0A0P7HF41_9EURY|nr:glycosyltransferase family 2 protein [Halolamina pelagica]KPN32325.1 glycosyltransferase AglI [Halolamina pelagica]
MEQTRSENATHSPTVSAVIINYNTAELTKRCVDSLEESAYPITEILVVDNASDEADQDKLTASLSHTDLHFLSENRGFAGGCNYGVRKATGDYIFFLNSDAVIISDTVTKLVEDLKLSSVGAVVPQVRLEHDHDLIDKGIGALDELGFGWHPHHLRPVGAEEVPDETCETLWGSGCAMLVDCAVFDELGGFDEDFFMYVEDLEFCLRLQEDGWTVLYEPDSVVFHGFSQSVKQKVDYGKNSFQIYHQNINRAKMLTKHFPLTLLAKGLPILILSFLYWNLILAWRDGIVQATRAFSCELQYAVRGLREREAGRNMEWTTEIQSKSFAEYVGIGLDKEDFYKTVKDDNE